MAACCRDLYTLYDTPAIGSGQTGYFIYLGHNAGSASGPWADPAVDPYYSGAQIGGIGTSGNTATAFASCAGGGACSVSICFDDGAGGTPTTTGFHAFEYIAGVDSTPPDPPTCTTTPELLIIEVVDMPFAGDDENITLCSSDATPYVIYDWFDPVPVGSASVWQNPGAVSDPTYSWNGAGYDNNSTVIPITDDTFTASVAGPGIYYRLHKNEPVSATYSYANCPSCSDTALITVTVVDSPEAGVATNATVCN